MLLAKRRKPVTSTSELEAEIASTATSYGKPQTKEEKLAMLKERFAKRQKK